MVTDNQGRKFANAKAMKNFLAKEQRRIRRANDGTSLYKFGQAALQDDLTPVHQPTSKQRRIATPDTIHKKRFALK